MAKRFAMSSDQQQDQSQKEYSHEDLTHEDRTHEGRTHEDRTHEGRIKAQGASAPLARCPACGQPEQLVWVHGHGQCAHCRMNVMPCCDGAVCESGE
jgi:hypothetical protein